MARREEIFESEAGGGGGYSTEDTASSNSHFAAFRTNLLRSELIDSSRVDASHAFEVFAGKSFFTPSNPSQSQSCVSGRGSTGGSHNKSNNIIEGGGGSSHQRSIESPTSRLMRIRSELSELILDLEDLDRGEDDSFWCNVQEEAKTLSDTADDISNHPYFQAAKSKSTTSLIDLRKVLNGLKSSGNPSRSSATHKVQVAVPSVLPSSSLNSSGLSQQFDNSNHNNDYKLLEKRLAALERVIGDSTSSEIVTPQSIINRNSISMSNSLPIVDTLARLEKRISLLDANSLEQIKGKASKLKDELERVNKIRQSGPDASMTDAMRRVDELSVAFGKIEPIAEELPAVILRLKTLEKVHVQSVTFLNRLQEAESDMANTKDKVRQNQALIQNMRQGFAENLEIMYRNISNVESKISQSGLNR